MKCFVHLLILSGFMVVLAACSGPAVTTSTEIAATQPATTQREDLPRLIDVLSENTDLVLFINALGTAGVLPTLDGEGPFTVFAPTNVAFTKMGLATSQLDPQVLQEVLGYHIASGRFTVAEGVTAVSAPTLQGDSITFTADGDTTKANYAAILTADIAAANGIVHIVDTVLLPPEKDNVSKSVWGTLVNDGRFTELLALMGGSEAMYTLRFDDFADAILAPTDEAFSTLPKETLTPLFPNGEGYDILFTYWLLAPDGWPRGTPLTTADLLEMGELQTQIRRVDPNSPFAFTYETLRITKTADGLMIGEAHVIEGDIEASNGIIHAIDKVLLPQSLTEHQEN